VRKPSIGGLQEAKVVSDWTKKRARGERVPVEPPSLAADGSIVQTTSRMGRIDSPAGRKMAAQEAELAAKEQAKRDAAAEKAAKLAAAELAKAPPPPPVTEEQVPVMAVQEAPEMAAQEAARPGVLSRVGKRFTSLFGS
jgi:hypothetical protein